MTMPMKTPPPENQCIRHDSFDYSKFNRMVNETDLAQTITAGMPVYQQFPELVQDSFYSLFKFVPQFNPAVAEPYLPNMDLLTKMQSTTQYDELRCYTKLDPINSAIGSATLSETILAENKEQFDQMRQARGQAQQLQQQVQQMQNAIQSVQAQPQTIQTQLQLQQLQAKAQQLIAQHQAAQGQFTQAAQTINVYAALKATTQSLKNQEEILGIGRGAGAGTPSKVSIQERLKFSRIFVQNKEFQKLLKLLGRMRRLAEKKQREKTKHANETIDNIKQSNDLFHLVPSEALSLCDPDLEILFEKKFVESQLLTYELARQVEKGKGPIVACLDVSGSMEGDPDVMAKAVALALVHIAQHQKRDAVIILFDDGIQLVTEFPKDDPHYWEKMVKMAEYFSGGGTNFTPPLKKALTYFTGDAKYTKADLVWITDGDGSLDYKLKTEFLTLKMARKISCYAIIIGGLFRVDHELKIISDSLVGIDHLTDAVAGDLFEAI